MELNHLKEYLQSLADCGIALAFSGGVDSTLLLAVLGGLAKDKPFRLKALTMQSVLQDSAEIGDAAALAAQFGVEHQIFTFNPFTINEVKHNCPDRCYHCKKNIFSRFIEYAASHNLKYVLDGTNADDLTVYRPGRKALKELGVISPFAELGIAKTQIRKISDGLNLPTASKPAVPCLATRFEYHTLLDDEKINRVAAGEAFIKKSFPEIKDIRLRVHHNLARLEVSKEFIPQIAARAGEITNALKKLGFDYVSLDLEGFRSGSLDIGLNPN